MKEALLRRTRLVLPLALLSGCVGVASTSISAPRPAIQPIAAAFTCAPDPGLLHEQAALLDEVNDERRAAGLRPVRYNDRLAAAAHGQACDNAQRGSLDHIGSDGSRPGVRALRAGYDYKMVAENLGLGFHSAPQAMFYWMRSPGHRKNVLAADATDAALGLTVSRAGQRAWVLVMGRQR